MRVLAVGCHPDDLEIACGGTLRKYVEQGAEVYMCHVANGCLGHVVIEPEELRIIRTKEAENAGAIIGAKQVFNLDVPDLEVHSHNFEVMDAMADVVRFVRPDVMITHNPDDYMLDHTETSVIATNGAFCSGLNHRPRKFEAFSSFIPTFFMDTLAVWGQGLGYSNVWQYMLIVLVGFNFIFEMGTNIFLSPLVVRLLKFRKKQS